MKVFSMKRLSARIVAALTVLLVALPAGALGSDQYFCRMMGRLVDDCCCKADSNEHQAATKSSSPEIKARSCCERVERGTHAASPGLKDSALRVASPLVATVSPLAGVVPEAKVRALGLRHSRARAPPLLAERIFLKNCSLLT
jgi:hypothetical protein